MKIRMLGATAVAAVTMIASAAEATVVNFDDLTGLGLVAEGYAGITWSDNWYHHFTNDPFVASSGEQFAFVNYFGPNSNGDAHIVGEVEAVAFKFSSDVIFEGASFSGATSDVSFQLYNNGSLVGVSGIVTVSNIPAFLSSGYAGVVDEVRVSGRNAFYVMDDLTYHAASAAVPEPATWGLFIAGFGLAGATLRRRKVALT